MKNVIAVRFVFVILQVLASAAEDQDLWKYAWAKLSDVGLMTQDELPSGRMYATVNKCGRDCTATPGDALIFFGGVSSQGASSSVILLNTTINSKCNKHWCPWEWIPVDVTGVDWWKVPPGLFGHTSVLHTGTNLSSSRMVTWGGENGAGFKDEGWMLQVHQAPQQLLWSVLWQYQRPAPHPRAFHSAVKISLGESDYMVIYGGVWYSDNSETPNDPDLLFDDVWVAKVGGQEQVDLTNPSISPYLSLNLSHGLNRNLSSDPNPNPNPNLNPDLSLT